MRGGVDRRRGLSTDLVRHVLRRGLEVDMTQHLGYQRHGPDGRRSGNSRSGTYPKDGHDRGRRRGVGRASGSQRHVRADHSAQANPPDAPTRGSRARAGRPRPTPQVRLVLGRTRPAEPVDRLDHYNTHRRRRAQRRGSAAASRGALPWAGRGAPTSRADDFSHLHVPASATVEQQAEPPTRHR